jgi:hypothetical protein
MNQPNTAVYVTLKELCALTKLSEASAKNLVKTGAVRELRVSPRVVRYDVSSLLRPDNA